MESLRNVPLCDCLKYAQNQQLTCPFYFRLPLFCNRFIFNMTDRFHSPGCVLGFHAGKLDLKFNDHAI
jgi:hypothetical protein